VVTETFGDDDGNLVLDERAPVLLAVALAALATALARISG